MKWISNGDPPLYVREGDTWYNQKTKILYLADLDLQKWIASEGFEDITFPKKTKVFR